MWEVFKSERKAELQTMVENKGGASELADQLNEWVKTTAFEKISGHHAGLGGGSYT